MYRIAQIAVALLLILGTGFVHGTWTSRWQVAHELEEAAARLERAPEDISDWKASPSSLDAGSLARAGAVGSWIRTYRHEGSGDVLTIILLCGRSGQMSVHRPEDCYRTAGYDVITPITKALLNKADGTPAEFRTAIFSKPGPDGPSTLRILWTWYNGSAWQAPDSPRLTFAHLPALYKLYVIRALARPGERLERGPAVAFLQQLLPELDKALSPAETSPPAPVVPPVTTEQR
jgi:hypothetical protein